MTAPAEPSFDPDLPGPWLAALRRYLARARKIASDPERKPSAISDLGTAVSKAARKSWGKLSPVATTREQVDAQQALLIRMEDCEVLVRRYAIAFEEYARQLRHAARELEIARLEREHRARLRDANTKTPAAAWTRRFRVEHEGDPIGYCFARTEESALKAFRAAHGIPDEIWLTATE